MGLLSTLTGTIALSALFSGAAAHPDTAEELAAHLAARDRLIAVSKRSLGLCSGSEAAVGLRTRAMARRAAKAQELRVKRGLENQPIGLRRRDSDDLTSWAGSSHELSSSDYSLNTPFSELFSSNATCALVPETTIGPYWVAGELERTDITDGQSGVPIHLDIQFVDVSTCEAVSDLLIDIWHCNSTGVYSGVAAEGQGGLDTTHGRGIQISDSEGVVEFDSIYPGHYEGRTTHIHVLATEDATAFDNGTFTGGTAKHIGQMFFDDDLTTNVEALEPYSTNTQSITLSTEDSIAAGEATAEYDPYLNYVRLGDSLQDGLLMWITIAIDMGADYSDNATPAAHYYEDGGVAEENSNIGGPGGDMPGGQPPSGNMTLSMAPSMSTTSMSSDATPSDDGSAVSSTVSEGGAARLRILPW